MVKVHRDARRARRAARRAARHALRLPGERRRHLREGAGLLRARASVTRSTWPASGTADAGALVRGHRRRSARRRPATCSPARAARPTRCGSGRARRCPSLLAAKLHRRRRRHVRQRRRAHPRRCARVPVYEIYKAGRAAALARRASTCSAQRPACAPPSSRTTTTPRAATTTPASATSANAASPRWSTSLPDGAFVLGVDEHTAVGASTSTLRTAAVLGLGGVTVRQAGRSTVWPAGSSATSTSCARRASGARPDPPRPGRRRPAEAAGRGRRRRRADAAHDRGQPASRRPSTPRSPPATCPPRSTPSSSSTAAPRGVVGRHDAVRRARPGAGHPALDDRAPRRAGRLGGAAIRPRCWRPFVEACWPPGPRPGPAKDWALADELRDRLPPPASRSATPPTARPGT